MTLEQRSEAAQSLVYAIGAALNDVYEPAGMLLFWSSRIGYLDNRRPHDLWLERDVEGLTVLAQRVHALAEGAFS